MNIRLNVGVPAALLLFAGCITSNDNAGGNPNSTGMATLTGTIGGQSFAPSDAISVNATTATPPGSVGAVAITSQVGLCGRITSGQNSKNAQYLILVMGDYNTFTQATVAPSAPGTYTIYVSGQRPAQFAGAVYQKTDANCRVTSTLGATSGSVTITSASGGSFSGSFELTLETTGDHITGTFTSANCALLENVLNQTTQLQCG